MIGAILHVVTLAAVAVTVASATVSAADSTTTAAGLMDALSTARGMLASLPPALGLGSLSPGPARALQMQMGLGFGTCELTFSQTVPRSACCNFTSDLFAAVTAAAPACPSSVQLLQTLSSRHLLLMENDTATLNVLESLCVASCWGPIITPLISKYNALAMAGANGCADATFISSRLQLACLRDTTTGAFCHQVLRPLEQQLLLADQAIFSSGGGSQRVIPANAALAAPCASSCIASASALYASSAAFLSAMGVSRDAVRTNASTATHNLAATLDAAVATELLVSSRAMPRLLNGICMVQNPGLLGSPRCGAVVTFGGMPGGGRQMPFLSAPGCIADTCARAQQALVTDEVRIASAYLSISISVFGILNAATGAGAGGPQPSYDPQDEAGNLTDWEDDYEEPYGGQHPPGTAQQGPDPAQLVYISNLLNTFVDAIDVMDASHSSVVSPSDPAFKQLAAMSCGVQGAASCADWAAVFTASAAAPTGAPLGTAVVTVLTNVVNQSVCPAVVPGGGGAQACAGACSSSFASAVNGPMGCCR